MLFWTIRTTIISITLIFLVHHLILFFTKTLTVPKIKDLVNAPAHKYENIYNTISSTNSFSSTNAYSNNLYTNDTYSANPYANTDDAPLPSQDNNIKPDAKSMKSELKNFLKKKFKGTTDTSSSSTNNPINTTDISALDTLSSTQYSVY